MPAPPASYWPLAAPGARDMPCSQPPARAHVESSCTPCSTALPGGAPKLPACAQTPRVCAGGLREGQGRGGCPEAPAPAASLRPGPCICDEVWRRCPVGTGGVQASATPPDGRPSGPRVSSSPTPALPSAALLGEVRPSEGPAGAGTASRGESPSWPRRFRSRPPSRRRLVETLPHVPAKPSAHLPASGASCSKAPLVPPSRPGRLAAPSCLAAERRRWVQAAARLLISAVPGFSARKPAGKGEQQAKHRAAGRGSEARPLPSPPSPSPGRSRPRARRFPLCLANTVASRHHLSGRGCILQNPCHFKTSGSLSQPPPKAKPSTHTGEHSPPPPPPPPLPLLRLPITNESFPFTPRTVEALMLICTHTHDDP